MLRLQQRVTSFNPGVTVVEGFGQSVRQDGKLLRGNRNIFIHGPRSYGYLFREDRVKRCAGPPAELWRSIAVPTIVWFRQDLRTRDNPALAAPATRGRILTLFILDDITPDHQWRWGGASRWWLHHSFVALQKPIGHLALLRADPPSIVTYHCQGIWGIGGLLESLLRVVCDRTRQRIESFAAEFGY